MNTHTIKLLHLKIITTFSILALLFTSCASDSADDVADEDDSSTDQDEIVISVDASFFFTEDGSVTITIVPCTLSDGTETDCYQIVSTSLAGDHEMGPWCPSNIGDGAESGGIWLEGGTVYDVDGEFIENLATFYDDNEWLLYDENGDIYVTETLDDCINAANPNVGDAYKNFCVECIPSLISDVSRTWLIPITPVQQTVAYTFATGPGGVSGPSTRGVALNGIEFSAPAPVDNILGAYTLAPFDDAGGHINVNQGYHYHATTGYSTKIEQEDGHAALIGYALDGYGIFQLLDEEGEPSTDLDDLRGHYDDTRGYHYHADEPGNNNFINGLRGAYAN